MNRKARRLLKRFEKKIPSSGRFKHRFKNKLKAIVDQTQAMESYLNQLIAEESPCLPDCHECPESRSESYSNQLPIDERRTDCINKALKYQHVYPHDEMERAVSGQHAEWLGKCERCLSCKQCKKILVNAECSIKKIQEDATFSKCVRIDEKTGKVTCFIPLPINYPELLPYNRKEALRKLIRELTKVQSLHMSKAQIAAAFQKYRDSGFIKLMEEMTEEEQRIIKESGTHHYMQCTFAYKMSYDKQMSARICMDASANCQGQSLNKHLPTGDTSNIDVIRTFQNFLTMPVIALGDIKSYYPSHHLHPSQWSLQRFLWIDNLDPKGKPKEYFLTRLFFGLSPVGRLTGITLEKLAEMYPHVSKILTRGFYVDDLLLGGFTKKEVEEYKNEIERILDFHGFKFKEWFFSWLTTAATPEGDVGFMGSKYYPGQELWAIKVPHISKGFNKKGQTEMLEYFKGDTVDELKEFYDNVLTLRKLLSKTMQFYDSSGVSSPVIGSLRKMIRTATRASQGSFDLQLPEEMLTEFCQKVLMLNEFKVFRYPRTFHQENPNNTDITICIFSDAGLVAKQIVSYTTMQKNEPNPEDPEDKHSVSFLGARNALTRDSDSVPKAELDALWMAALMVEAQKRNLDPYVKHIRAFIDSEVVGKWLTNWEINLSVYHRVRVAQILNTFTDSDGIIRVYWIRRHLNVADEGTHGISVPKNVGPDSDFFRGPSLLKKDIEDAEKSEDIVRVDKLTQRLEPEQLKLFNEGLVGKCKMYDKIAKNIDAITSKEKGRMITEPEVMSQISPPNPNMPPPEEEEDAADPQTEVAPEAARSDDMARESFDDQKANASSDQADAMIAFSCESLACPEVFETNNDPTNEVFTSTVSVENSMKLYAAGKYLMNPFKIPFDKMVLTHMVALGFVIRCLGRCEAKAADDKKRKNFGAARQRLLSKGNQSLGFAHVSHSNFKELEEVCQNKKARRDLDYKLRVKDQGVISKSVESRSFLSQVVEASLFNSAHHSRFKDLRSDTSQLEALLDSVESHEESFVAQKKLHADDQKSIRKKNKRTWQRYPGLPFVTHALQIMHSNVPLIVEQKATARETLNVAASIVNVSKFLDSFDISAERKSISNDIRHDFYEATKALKTHHVSLIQEVLDQFAEKPSCFVVNQQVFALDSWLRIEELTISLPGKPASKMTLLENVPKYLLSDVIGSSYEFAVLQLMTFELFHQILTREIKASWSNEKINQNCESIDGKLVSSWRLRAGFDVGQLVGQEYDLAEERILSVDPRLPPVIPCGSKNSPLIMSLCLYIHYNEKLNLLQRPKMWNHSGIYENRIRLYHNVYVPGVLNLLKTINRNCVSCRIRLKKYIQFKMGPLHPSVMNIAAPFSTVQMDAYGPMSIRLKAGTRDTKRRHFGTQQYVLVFVCLQTKMVHLEPIDDQKASSIANAFICMAGRYQLPRHVICDRFPAQIHFVSLAEFEAKVNHHLIKIKNMRFTAIPVGNHEKSGLVESKIKIVGKLLGPLNMEGHGNLNHNSFRTVLSQIQEMINSTPLGLTMNQKDSTLQLLTPHQLAGGINKRVPFGPAYIPRDTDSILKANQDKWEEIVRIYEKVVIPMLVKQQKWHYTKEDDLQEGDVVMFQKKTQNNFSPGYSIARIVKLIPSLDKKPRSIEIEYLGGTQEVDTAAGTISSKEMKRTTRDSHNLIVILPITNTLNDELEELFMLIENNNKSRFFESLYINSSSPDGDFTPVSHIRCAACINSVNVPKNDCRICTLSQMTECEEVVIRFAGATIFGTITCQVPTTRFSSFLTEIGGLCATYHNKRDFEIFIRKVIMDNLGTISTAFMSRQIYGPFSVRLFVNDELLLTKDVNVSKGIPEKKRLSSIIKPLKHIPNIAEPGPEPIDFSHFTNKIKWKINHL